MSKYNHSKSIPLESLKKEEREAAIKEWAEGSLDLENLLWTCLDNGIETTGCHYGAGSYLDIRVNNEHDKVRKMLFKAQGIEGTQILVTPDGGNPFSGPSWYKPCISFDCLSKSNKLGNEFFLKLNQSINNEIPEHSSEDKVFEHMLDFYDFFKGKETGLVFRSKYKENKYTFNIEAMKNNINLDYFKTFFGNTDMEFSQPENTPLNVWRITAKTPREFNEKIEKCKGIIMNELSTKLETEIKDGMGFSLIANIKRREFGDTPEGAAKLEEWIKNKYDEYKQREKERSKLSKSIETGTVYKDKGILPNAIQKGSELLGKAKQKLKGVFSGKEDRDER